MLKYIISTESGSDLTQEMIEKYDIRVVPMHVNMSGETFNDGDFPASEIYDYYDTNKVLPQTSGTTPHDNEEHFKAIFSENPDAHIIHIGYSAVTTVSFQAAIMAAEDLNPNKITLVDSKQVSVGLARIAIETAKFVKDNHKLELEEIVHFIETLRDKTHFHFLPQTLLYLKAGGRVSSLAFHGANILKINPTIVMDDGYLVPGKKYRGSFERNIVKLIDHFMTECNIQPESVLLCATPGSTEQQREIAYQRLREHGVEIDDYVETGAVIATHGGPGVIGIAGIEK
ncbi:DegV family protein [Aerococcaceae bacterium DSM 111020]|nr:DegV family protein [Aerococcaceae bacterium DSM 111020]